MMRPFKGAHQSAMTHLPNIGGPFPYPPHYLILLSMLAVLPYGAAFIAFIAATLLIYAVMVIAISQRKEAIFFALATPGMAACIETGQNGFLTASLMGVALVLRESSPRFAGLGLALLTYKPQMGVLFPAALTLERRWIVMASAAVATVALLTIALAAFGTRTFMEFPQALAAVADATVFTDRIGYEKLQSVYGLARYLGFTARAAWGAHLAVAFIAVAAVAGTWRKPERPWLKAAVLTSAALLISPHLFLYDMPVCGVAIAFLVRDRDLAPLEWAAVLGACALASFLEFWLRPFGVFSTLAVFSVASLRSLKA